MVRSVAGKSHEIDEILEILNEHEDQLVYPRFDETTGMFIPRTVSTLRCVGESSEISSMGAWISHPPKIHP